MIFNWNEIATDVYQDAYNYANVYKSKNNVCFVLTGQ